MSERSPSREREGGGVRELLQERKEREERVIFFSNSLIFEGI